MKAAVRKAVFPVGGLGTRFLPATKALPKEMLPIVDKPLIHYAVDRRRGKGHGASRGHNRPLSGRLADTLPTKAGAYYTIRATEPDP